MSLIVKIGKKGKRLVKRLLPEQKRHLSYARRIERVRTDRRVCAMTFDDGPMDLPAAPDRFGGRALTDVLLDALEEFGAKGTFDVIGDTSENYPDQAGKLGSAAWGGVKYDHYPDIGKDGKGGAATANGWSAASWMGATRSPTTATATSSSAKSPLSTGRGSTWAGWTRRWTT